MSYSFAPKNPKPYNIDTPTTKAKTLKKSFLFRRYTIYINFNYKSWYTAILIKQFRLFQCLSKAMRNIDILTPSVP